MLDNFALMSGQLNSLKQLLRGDKMPALRNFVLFPVLLSQDPDPHLEKLTEGRVVSCNHDLVPDYLRTKPEPEVEEKINLIANKAANVNIETATKQLNSLNKITSNLLDIINSSKDEWENDAGQKGSQPQTSQQQDTTNLVAAVTKGLRLRRPDPSMQQMQAGPIHSMQQVQNPRPGMGKMPSAIKTNIKSGSAHPYQRP
ncbi:mediator of RNA polymerase II transcription subunit 8-A-like isoform X2 [Littorina saxatilis]